ncbi:MAG: bifunctional riboflavin kinase/FAD synthetase [Gemmatimonadota bacterium]|nr:bifunctional riboflavin kinase/FAD synthetase [Gemmatimonadota bacterium]
MSGVRDLGGAWIPGERHTTVTVGTFDGVHRGHQAVLAEIVRRARATDRASVLVTFEPHPLQIVAPERAPDLLTTAAEKRLLWPLFGLDYVVEVPFTESLRRMEPEAFVRRILVERLRVGELVIGYDHGFGKDRKGDVDVLRSLGESEGFEVDVVGAVGVEGNRAEERAAISSTEIRRAVARADFETATRGLARPYSAVGEVVHGAGRGEALGYATANVRTEPKKCLPPDGVYAVRMELDGEAFDGMANLGASPTFDDFERRLEVHAFDWSGGSLYGARPRVEFVERLRAVERFDHAEALVEQIERDEADARAALARPESGRPAVSTPAGVVARPESP